MNRRNFHASFARHVAAQLMIAMSRAKATRDTVASRAHLNSPHTVDKLIKRLVAGDPKGTITLRDITKVFHGCGVEIQLSLAAHPPVSEITNFPKSNTREDE